MMPVRKFGLAACLAAMALPVCAQDVVGCLAIADDRARLACFDERVAALRDKEQGARAQAAKRNEQQFGLPTVPSKDPAQDRIESTVAWRFEGWYPGARITLANGQVWVAVGGSSTSYSLEKPRVTIQRGVLGSYSMQVEGVGPIAKVRRAQ